MKSISNFSSDSKSIKNSGLKSITQAKSTSSLDKFKNQAIKHGKTKAIKGGLVTIDVLSF